MIGNALSRLALAGFARRDAAEPELIWPGNPGHVGGLTNEQIDCLLESFEAHAGPLHASRAA